jgi:hypothetical protein
MKMKTVMALSVAVAALAIGFPAMADITIEEGNCSGCGVHTVHLTDDVPGDNFVNGWVASQDISVLFTGEEEIAPTGGQGQAWVGGVDGSTDYLKFEVVDHTFDALVFNLNTDNGGGPPKEWGVTITGYDQFGTAFSQDFTGITNNQFFNLLIKSGSGEHMSSMTFRIDGADANNSPILAAGQFRVGGISGVVPEPASWMMMILGLGGVGGLMRYRRHTGRLARA